uniref:biotin/lipoyl-containing protein n=1 Tax=Shewanella sp. TaxID=50422 RepID=UPI003D1094DC
MIKDFILPDIGEGVVECELVEWLVAEGDTVTEDQPIADVMTDKALVQIPAVHAGVIKKLHYKKGDIAIVHEPLYSVEIDGEAADDVASEPADEKVVQSDSQQNIAGKRVEEFLLPDIGEGIVECELVEWLVQEGDMVVEDQPIADVMTDKALVQIPAIKSGKVVKLHYRKGQLAQVHTPLFSIEVESEEGAVAAPVADTAPAAVDHEEVELHAPAGNGKALASPAVRRLARSYDIDLSLVPGSGKHGRVYKEDVERFR